MRFGKIKLGNFFDRVGYSEKMRYDSSVPCNSNPGGISGGACNKNAPSYSGGNGCGCNRDSSYNFPSSTREDSANNCSEQSGGWGIESNYKNQPRCTSGEIRDRGNEPIVFDIRREAFMTPDFRTALWTGGNLQLTVMTVPIGEETGVEKHEGLDQLVGVISGAGEVVFGNRENYFAPPIPLDAHSVILIPAGTYHNIKNVGRTPLKLYSVYAPKAHKFGTVDKTNTQQ